MLPLLQKVIDADEFSERGVIDIRRVEQTDEDSTEGLLLFLDVVPAPEEETQRWQIKCLRVEDYSINHDLAEWLQIASEHPLLWPHGSDSADLYFYAPAKNPATICGELWRAHFKSVQHWLPFSRYLNRENQLFELLKAESGKLASGPIILLEAYAEVLRESGIPHSIANRRSPTVWRDGQWVDARKTLCVLIVGASWVVAGGFEESGPQVR